LKTKSISKHNIIISSVSWRRDYRSNSQIHNNAIAGDSSIPQGVLAENEGAKCIVRKTQYSTAMHHISMKIATLVVALVATFLFPKLGWWAADTLAYRVGYRQFSVSWDIVHHVGQMLPPLLIMLLASPKRHLSGWGFSIGEKQRNFLIIGRFLIGFIICFTLGKLLYLWLNGWPEILDFDQKGSSPLAIIIFRMVMPGLSEELLFRAFIMTILMAGWRGVVPIGKVHLPIAGILSALLFTLAHVGYSLDPLSITYMDPGQLLFAFLFGMFYAVAYYETKSILVPIITHNIIDGVGTLIDYLLTLLFYS
jgi:membrane protease YdiL (CAAX protease family)